MHYFLTDTTPAPLASTYAGDLLLWLTAGGAVAVGVLVILARLFVDDVPASLNRSRTQADGSKTGRLGGQKGSVIRSWLAVTLVFALVLFSAAAFLVDDDNVRDLLWGGLIASAGTAVAFYFSSKSSDQARSDLLNAAATLAQPQAKPTAFSQATPPHGTEGQNYPSYRFVADGHPEPTYYKNGSLPPGLELLPDGTLQGTPDANSANTYSFTVGARNASGSVTTDVTVIIDKVV